jgi:hypothetical protein
MKQEFFSASMQFNLSRRELAEILDETITKALRRELPILCDNLRQVPLREEVPTKLRETAGSLPDYPAKVEPLPPSSGPPGFGHQSFMADVQKEGGQNAEQGAGARPVWQDRGMQSVPSVLAMPLPGMAEGVHLESSTSKESTFGSFQCMQTKKVYTEIPEDTPGNSEGFEGKLTYAIRLGRGTARQGRLIATLAPARDSHGSDAQGPDQSVHVASRSSDATRSAHSVAHRRRTLQPTFAKELSHHGRTATRVGMGRVDSSCIKVARAVVESHRFDFLICAVIFANACLIGAQVDFQARNPRSSTPASYQYFEYVFGAVFFLELLLRIYVDGCNFFCMPGCAWNIFDTVLVALQIIDLVISSMTDNTTEVARSVRVIRVFRTVRVARVLRMVHLFDELRKLMYLIMASFASFVWTAFLLLILTYMFAIFFTQMVADYVQDNLDEINPDSAIFVYFGSTLVAINSLYKAITGGVDWEELSEPVMEHISVWLGLVFVFYVAFGALVILNLVTGVFVDGAFRLSKQDKHLELLKKVRKVFREDDDDLSAITRADFNRHMHTDDMQDVFSLIEINQEVAGDLFDYLDTDHSGLLSDIEFVDGAMKLQLPVKQLDILLMARELGMFFEGISARMNDLHKAGLEHVDTRMEELAGLRSQPVSQVRAHSMCSA